jgi:hypothetical protein
VLDLQPILLKRAAEIAGGPLRLCEYLGISMQRLGRWQDAEERLPDDVFLMVVDMVLRDDLARARGDRRQLPRQETRKSV